MDLLGSILNSMDKPPSATEKQKEIIKKQKEQEQKMINQSKNELNKFRVYVEERIDRFVKDDKRQSIQFQPLDKVYRSVIHDVCEIAGLVGLSFGQEGIDRYTIVYKRGFSPSEDEVTARRNGEEWNLEIAKEYAKKKKEQFELEKERTKEPEKVTPKSNYKDKYVHLIGEKAALDAAKKTETNKSYGFVPSENKKDVRSIEQTMADIQAKKRLKVSHDTE